MCAVWKLIYLLKMNNKIVRIKLQQNAFTQHYCEIHINMEQYLMNTDQMWSNIEIAESNSVLWIVMQVMVELLMIFTICNH